MEGPFCFQMPENLDILRSPSTTNGVWAHAVVPRRLQTQAVLLIPYLLLGLDDQTKSADALLHCLRANVWGGDVCQELRVPIFAALNVMELPNSSAGDICSMLMEVRHHPCSPHAELILNNGWQQTRFMCPCACLADRMSQRS